MAAYLPKHNTILRRHLVVLNETRNRADTKVSVTVEPEFFSVQALNMNNRGTSGKFSNKCESNLKPDSRLYSTILLDNKKNQTLQTAATFVNGQEFILVLAQLDTEGNILTKFKNPDQWSWRRCDNKKCLQLDGRRRVPRQ